MSIRLAKTCLIALYVLGLAGTVNRPPQHTTPPQEVITRMPGEQPRHWRSLRTIWKVWPGSGDTEDYIQAMALRGDLLYYRCPSEAGCIQTITGRYLWRHPFYKLPPPGRAQVPKYDKWHIAISDRFVYTIESRYSGNTLPPAFHLYALQRNNGQQAWEYVLKQNPLGVPCPAGGMVLTPLSDGTVLALNSATGEVLWRKPISGDGSRIESVVLQVDAETVVAQIGSGRIAAFHLRDGKQIWSYSREGLRRDDGSSHGFSIDHGIAYALLSDDELVALNVADGRRRWSRHTNGSGSPSGAVSVLGDSVLSTPAGEVGAVRKGDGQSLALTADPHRFEYVIKEPFVMSWPSGAAPGRKPKLQLFQAINGIQLVDGVPRKLRSASATETLVMLDAATGAEQWRWQPEDGVSFETILSDGHRIYLQDYHSIRAVEDGPNPMLPATPDKRRALARFLVQAVFHGFTMFDKEKGRWISVAGSVDAAQEVPDSAEANLKLVKLGADSVPAVMEQVHQDVANREKVLPNLKEWNAAFEDFPNSLSEAMDLLTDIGDQSCVPGLMAELSGAKHPGSRRAIARALIRLGDSRALPALMQYARTSTNDPNTRQDALFAVAGAAQGTSVDNALTQYLLTVLGDATAPASLRLFARFELLNNRGAELREAALATFKAGKPARLIPEGLILTSGVDSSAFNAKLQEGFPRQVSMMSTTRDTSGKTWGAFYCDYIGRAGDLWVAQSTDGTHWTRPMFAMNLDRRCSRSGRPGIVKISSTGNVMVVRWDEQDGWDYSAKPLVHVDRLAMADLERDSDGDGINDLLKLEIGTGRHTRNATDKTIPGKEEQKAIVRSEAATNEAGIFEAAVEALCQVGRDGDPTTKPVRFGGCMAPLVLPLLAGDREVYILGHPGPVVFRPLTDDHSFPGSRYETAGYNFTPPHIDLNGYYHTSAERQLAVKAQRQDPYAKLNRTTAGETKASFRNYFPYEISADGNRARVGWEQRLGDREDRGEVRFDIEVRKMAGKWYPVECRCLFAYGHHWSEEAVVPDTRLSAIGRP